MFFGVIVTIIMYYIGLKMRHVYCDTKDEAGPAYLIGPVAGALCVAYLIGPTDMYLIFNMPSDMYLILFMLYGQ